MSSYRDWLFFVPAILAVVFMIWVFFKFTEQLAGAEKSKRQPETDSRYLRVVTAAPPEERRRVSTQSSWTHPVRNAANRPERPQKKPASMSI